MTDRATLSVYDAKAADYQRLVQDVDDPSLHRFLDGLPTGATIIDLGAGPGHFTAAMVEKGFNAEAWDASAEMVKLARARNLTAYQRSFDALADAREIDGIWANFSLLHAAESDLPRHLADAHAALVPGGRLHVAFKLGTGTARDSIGRRYTYVTEDSLTALLHQAGFTTDPPAFGEDKGLSGEIAPWIAMLAHA